jgi:cytochrome c553
MKKYLKWIGLGLLAVLLIMQFFQISKTNPAIVAEQDFINIHKPSAEVTKMLKAACYDCHSHETKYPWYTYTNPLAYWIKNHIVEGREELNFSTWATYSAKKADHKLEECVEKVIEKKMPLSSYTITHGDAKLTEPQIKQLAEFFNSLRQGKGTESKGNVEHEEEEDND